MKSITAEWIAKAEGDFATAQRELNAIQHANYDAVCFHAQQCAEKYLKGFLQETNIAFPKTHDLADLLALTLSVEPSWSSLRSDLNVLSSFAVEYRYPATLLTSSKPKRAFKSVRMSVRSSVGH